jgi:hypothetical protein
VPPFSNRFVMNYAVAVLGTAAVLSSVGVQSMELSYSLYAVEFFILLELFGSYRKTLIRSLRPASIAFFLGFMYVITQKALQILMAR